MRIIIACLAAATIAGCLGSAQGAVCSAFVPTGVPSTGRTERICVNAKKAATTKAPPKKAGGFGISTKTATTTKTRAPVADSATLLRQSMDLYEREFQYSEDESDFSYFKEYIVSVRSKSVGEQMSDWIPAAFLGLEWRGGTLEDNPLLQGIADHALAAPLALLKNRREIWECACQAAPSLNKVPRQSVEYAYEPLDSFLEIYELSKSKGGSAAEAYQTLGLAPGASAREIKSAHRKLIRELHPDSVLDKSDEHRQEAVEKFKAVQEAYEVLGGGHGGSESWYESLGGKTRADKFHHVDPMKAATELNPEHWMSAVQPVEPTIPRDFIMRNILRSNMQSLNN